jgi:hypothetical protein
MIGTRTDEECHCDLFEVKATTAPGHSGGLAIDFFKPSGYTAAEAEKRRRHTTEIREVMTNTAGAFVEIKRTWQLFVPNSFRQITAFVYDLLAGNRRAQDILKNDTEHLRQCCKINIGNFTFRTYNVMFIYAPFFATNLCRGVATPISLDCSVHLLCFTSM